MNKVCSWKTIALVALFLLAMIEISQGFAGPLTVKQKQYEIGIFKDVSQSDEVIDRYWNVEVARQVASLQSRLPIRTGEYTYLIDVKMNAQKRYIIYEYGIMTDETSPKATPTMDSNKFSENMCKDPEGRFFLITMKGTMIFNHYTKADPANSFFTVIVSSDNCQDI